MREKPPPYADDQATRALTNILLQQKGSCEWPSLLGFKIISCGWENDSDEPDNPHWKFYISTPDLNKIGSKEAYIRLHLFLDRLTGPAKRINWQDMTLEQAS